MRRGRYLVVFLAITLLIALGVQAQDIEPITVPDTDADIAITFPPPVWILTDSADILGTADVLNMTNYIIEYRELVLHEAGAAIDQAEPLWFPATLPGSQAVHNGVIGTWNTLAIKTPTVL